MKLNEVILAIRGMNNQEISTVIEAIKMQRQFNSRMATRSIRPNDRVQFNAGRNRGVITGTVQKVNIKNLRVKQDNTFTIWNVPASAVTHLTEENK
jgi:hypothetical protein